MLVACATLAALFPFVGTIIYMIVRPPEFLDDVRLRELEMQAAEARLSSFDHQLCPYCDYAVKGDYLRCPSCLRRLRSAARLQQADRPRLEAVPVLRGRDGRRPVALARAGAGRRDGRRQQAVRPAVRAASLPPRLSTKEPLHGPDPHPGQAGRVRARSHRRDHRPLRAQGPAHRRAQAHDDHTRARRAALRRARRQAVLRRAGGLHHLRPAGGDGARGRAGRARRAPGDRRDQPARGRPRLDPRRLRRRGRPEHGPRLRRRRSPPSARPRCSSPDL